VTPTAPSALVPLRPVRVLPTVGFTAAWSTRVLCAATIGLPAAAAFARRIDWEASL